MASSLSLKRIQISVFLISAALISYQILLVKMFSIQYWYHFAYLIISIALLGFGASGSFIVLFKKQLQNRLSLVLFICPLFLVLSIWMNVYMNHSIAFNPLMIIWHKQEIIHLLVLSFSIFVPFFAGALCVGLTFVVAPDHIHKMYFANLAGSGLGCLTMLPASFYFSPYEIMFLISLITICAALGGSINHIRQGAVCVAGIVFILVYIFLFRFLPLPMSTFKDLSQAENLMSAKKEMDIFGPFGLVTVLSSPAYHYLPDLSLNCPYPLPRQKGLFLNGNSVGAINEFSGNFNDARFMDYRTASLAYTLLHNPDVLIIGGGSGTEILNAVYHAAKDISVVEMNADIVHLMREPYGNFSGNIYTFGNTHVFIEDGRGYLQRTKRRFDLIQISLLESGGTASAGVYSLNENYLFTTESLAAGLERLRPEGVLSISTWVTNPPRDTVKILAMLIDAMKKHGDNHPDQSIIMIRSWQTATILVKNGSFNRKDMETIRDFCKSRLFDISYGPGVAGRETNMYNTLEEDFFYHSAKSLLSPERENFTAAYPFYVKPATDDRPFFSHFFTMALAKEYINSSNRALIPFLDWGYILVWITACILFLLGMIFTLSPIPFIIPHQKGLISVLVYFGSLGMAYMFLEISILQQFIRYLCDPVFAATTVIGSFLVYSGLGSLIAGKLNPVKSIHIFWSAVSIGVACLMFLAVDQWLQNALSGLPLWMRILSCSLLIAPLAIPMGIPFPSGLSALAGEEKEDLIPWAWSINGFLSVMGSSASVLIAIRSGFKFVIMIAVLLYILSAFTFSRLLITRHSPNLPSLGGRD